ncbi:MAG: dTDP-4-dehydrorhamnose reductase [Acidimicrobiia bacterium]
MIAVLGASGQLGSAFVRIMGDSCLPVTRQDLDLEDPDSIESWVESTKPDLVINCAAYTAVDAAETDMETARTVNAIAVGSLADAAARHEARLVTFSTDYVFDGDKETGYVESDQPNPLNFYGRTKLEGERLALGANPQALVVRTSWLLSGTHANFASKMLELISKGPVRVVDDQRGRPTFVDDLVAATNLALTGGTVGILHLANDGQTTWFGLAQEIAEIAGLDPERVSPCPSSDYPRPAKRPLNSVLDSERIEDQMISPLPHYRPSLEATVREIREQQPHLAGG